MYGIYQTSYAMDLFLYLNGLTRMTRARKKRAIKVLAWNCAKDLSINPHVGIVLANAPSKLYQTTKPYGYLTI